jgi:hypothetical protein
MIVGQQEDIIASLVLLHRKPPHLPGISRADVSRLNDVEVREPAWLDRSRWQTFRFDQIAENIRESVMPTPGDSANYRGLEHMDTGSLHGRRQGSETDLIGRKLRMRKGDILFARRNAGPQPLPEAGATQERPLEAVSCRPLFGPGPRRRVWTTPPP